MKSKNFNMDLQVGDRVDVRFNTCHSWQAKAGMHNGIVKDIISTKGLNRVHVERDELSLDIAYHRPLNGGWYNIASETSGYFITKL